MGRFLWNNNEDHHGYHLAYWQLVAPQKELWGLWYPRLEEPKPFSIKLVDL
jgi:hypothetical protein